MPAIQSQEALEDQRFPELRYDPRFAPSLGGISPSRAALILLLCCAAAVAAQHPAKRSSRETGRDTFLKQCAVCHHENSGTRAPLPSALRQMSSQEILAALETGVMKAQGASLTPEERQSVAFFLGRRQRSLQRITTGFCASRSAPLLPGDPAWNGWSPGPTNTRFQPASQAGLSRDQLAQLKVKWAFGFPGFSDAQPTLFGGRLLVGSETGHVYSLDAATGCVYWIFKAASSVRDAISVSHDGRHAYFGDSGANVYAVSMISGKLLWKVHVDPHPFAVVTGAPLLLGGRLYIPVSSGEEGSAINPYYPCCTFRGSVLALDASSGKTIWKTYTISTPPKPVGKNAAGTTTWGPSGVPVWSAPTADLRRHAIYVGTGNNYSDPGGAHSDAVLALDMSTGRLLWSRQLTSGDRWTQACLGSSFRQNCPPDPGGDYDVGTSPILISLPGGRSVILVGQKSGDAYALDPDRRGAIIWKDRLAKGGNEGGIEWGGAADAGEAFFPISDWRQDRPLAGGGLFALRVTTGAVIWHAKPPAPGCVKVRGCSVAQLAPATLIPGVVLSGSMDGHLRGYDVRDGRVIWDFDTARDFKTTDGIRAHGGSLNKNGPVAAGGMLYVESGNFTGMPGNLLLAFSVNGK
ncbi:MAG: PQQ-binding-like beta-propeller repeat protein [Terriglobia bacterium]